MTRVTLRSFVLAALTLPLLLSLGCGERAVSAAPPLDGLAGRITITGSSTAAPLLGEIAHAFEAEHPAVRIDVQSGGSSRGIRDVQLGLADIGMSSRELTAEEAESRASFTFAHDGVAFLVNRANPLEALSRDQLRAIYSGAVHDWKQVGGRADAITVIQRAAGRSEFELVGAYLGLAPEEIRADAIAGENQHGMKQVARDRAAITYMSVGAAALEIERGEPLRLLDLDGVEASPAAVASGELSLSRPLVLVTSSETIEANAARADAKAPNRALILAFIDYARSPAAHELIRQYAFIPIGR